MKHDFPQPSGGGQSTPQSFIEKLMVTAALEGKTVVRIKGGDPFIFGRGGEEVEALQAVGVRYQVINGITAGMAAASSLGAPATSNANCCTAWAPIRR